MPLLNDLLDFSDHPLMPPPSAQLFAEHLPVEWIQHCLTLSAHATVRRRRLPGYASGGVDESGKPHFAECRDRALPAERNRAGSLHARHHPG
ncbi:hypothetical protein A1U5_03161 [Escherichia coli KTE66]|nr:hypothetical protein A1U5_03161 [Escherichia coli KTE66]